MKLKQLKTIDRLITVKVPTNGGDGYDRQKMTAKYNFLSQTRIDELIEENDDEETLDEIFAGFSGITNDETGEVLEDNEENRNMVRGIPYIRRAIIIGFFEMASGGERVKN